MDGAGRIMNLHITEKELIELACEWAEKNLKPYHGKETYYARLGLLVDFITDLAKQEDSK